MPAVRFLSGRRNEKPDQKKRSRPIFLKKPVLRQDPFRGRTGQPQTDYQRPGFIIHIQDMNSTLKQADGLSKAGFHPDIFSFGKDDRIPSPESRMRVKERKRRFRTDGSGKSATDNISLKSGGNGVIYNYIIACLIRQ